MADQDQPIGNSEENAQGKSKSGEKFSQALKELGMDEHGHIHKEDAKKYYQMAVGGMCDELLVTVLVDHMKIDEKGIIDVDGIMEPFSLKHWPSEVLAGVRDLLENSAELQENYKEILREVLNLPEPEVEQLSMQSCKAASDYIRQQLEGPPPAEVESELMQAFSSRCEALVANCDCRQGGAEPSSIESPTVPGSEPEPQPVAPPESTQQ